jgi:hypothetical protein
LRGPPLGSAQSVMDNAVAGDVEGTKSCSMIPGA